MKAEKLVYFFEACELRTVFPDWPEEIGLALCLDDVGTCEMLLHHRDEGRDVLRKAAAVLGAPAGGFAVVPQVEGHPTRRVLFSDEQKLLKLVAGEDDLAEMADDYLINYRFEADRKSRPAPTPDPAPQPVAAAPKPAEPFRWRPRLHFSEPAPKPPRRRKAPASDMPEGYASAEVMRDADCQFVEAEISLGYRGVRVTLAPELVTITSRTVLVQEVGFRDDFSRFVLPRKAVAGWKAGEPLVIDIPEARFPAGLRQRFAAAPRTAEVTVTDHGVFVAPGAVLPPPAPEPEEIAPEPITAPAKSRPRRLLSPVRVALVALVGGGLMTGTMMNAVELPLAFDAPVFDLAFDAKPEAEK